MTLGCNSPKLPSEFSRVEKLLYSFTGAATGLGPVAGLVLDGSGNLYGVSQYSVFELSPGPNGTWTEQSLHNFAGGTDGAYPGAQLIFDKTDNLYGTTYSGGPPSWHGL